MHRLPARIAAVMIGTILLFLLALGGSMLWMSRALDQQAWEQSVAQIRNARNNLLDQVRLTTLDYAKWESAVDALDARDMGWIYDNLGYSANLAEVIQLAVIWGAGLPEDVGWADDDVAEGRPGLVGAGTLGAAERGVASTPMRTYEATQFFAWNRGSLFALAASRVEVPEEMDASLRDEEVGRLLLGRRVTDEILSDIEASFLLTGLEILRGQPPADRPSVPLLDGTGEPVAWLIWDAPRPGAMQLSQMLPAMAAVLALTTALAAMGMALVRRSARNLVVAKQEATVAALTDGLTGLPNRTAFNEALAAPARAGERAVLFLDVNDFKRINDSIGHAAGDLVIGEVARRLSRLCGKDRLLARIGGDEFVILLRGPRAGIGAAEVAREVERAMANPFDILGHQLPITAAVGHAVQASDAMTGEDLLRQADLAMYEAKRHQDQGPVAFDALIEQAVQDAQAIETALRAALDRGGEFGIAYQPIASPEGGLVRVEALARWTSPELGFVPPDRFIAVAERSGLIIRLGRVLLRLIRDDLAVHPDLRVSINISPLQLMAPTFVQDLLADLAEKGVDPGRIEVELTESVVVDDPGLAAERLRELHEAGFSTALDDFGTGYSSIGYLQQMGFDMLKIDRSFVSGFCESPERMALVNAMILLAHALGLRVTCEGVETEQEFRMLRELGCDLAQGYHLDRPLPIGALAERWLDGATVAVA